MAVYTAVTRNSEFNYVYGICFDEVRDKLFTVGPRGRVGGWSGGSRVQARDLARRMSRATIRANKEIKDVRAE